MNIAPNIFIEDSLRIRKPLKRDIKQRYTYGRSLEFRKMVGGSTKDLQPYELLNAESLYHREMKKPYSWFIELDGKMIGVCRLKMLEGNICRYSIGIYKDELFSKGIGTKVTWKVLEFAFDTLGVDSVELMVLAFNKRAVRCYEKCGFKQSVVLKDNLEIDGNLYDDIIMIIHRNTFQ